MRKSFGVLVPIAIVLCFVFLEYLFPDYEKLADKLTVKTAKELNEENDLWLIGIGGRMMDDIQMMAMSFQYYHEVDLEKARQLLVCSIEKYLKKINNNLKLRPYLHEYPFTAKNIEILIWIRKPDGSEPSLDKIYHVSAIDGILTYYLDLPETYSRKSLCEETYDEALQLVRNEPKTMESKNEVVF